MAIELGEVAVAVDQPQRRSKLSGGVGLARPLTSSEFVLLGAA